MYWKHLQRFGLFTIPSFGLILSSGIFSNSHAQTVTTNAYDNASNYPSNTWTNGANGGRGFQPWFLTSGNGTAGYGGNFVGNPSAAGITGMSSNSFGQFANPSGAGAYANAERVFSNALAVGQTLSFQWGINFDSGNGAFASKGVVFSAGVNEITGLNLRNAGSSVITIGDADVGFGYGTNVMTWSFTRTGDKLYKVVANGRDGNGIYSNNITVSNGAMDKIKFYAYNIQAGDAAQPYFNDLTIITTDADSVAPSIALAQGVERVTWVDKRSAFSLSTSDVTADDDSGTANVTFDPLTVDTSVDGLTKVTYTATDPTGNWNSVVRVVAVGDASPGWRKLHSPKSATASAINSPKVYGRIYIDGATPGPGQAPNITAELGVNTVDSDPSGWTGTGVWRTATYNAGFTGGDDEYESTINGAELTTGTYYYVYRFKIGSGAWQYAGINAAETDGGPWNGTTSLNGTLSVVPVRDVTFAVDMGVQAFRGAFTPGTDSVYLMGEVSNWTTGVVMTREGETSIYKATLNLGGAENATLNYKFKSSNTAVGNVGFEGDMDAGISGDTPRVLRLGAANVPQPLTTSTFNNQSEARKITVRVDMSIQQQAGSFNPSTGTVKVGGNFNDWTAASLVAQANGIYAGEFLVDGPLSAVEYRFINGDTYESINNRTITTDLPNLAASTLDPVYFNNHDVAVADSTFAGAYPGKSMTDVAPNGLTYLANYAFGGDSNTQPILPVQDMSDPDKLQLIVVYRTDDPTLPLSGLRGEATTDLSGAWDLPDVGVTNGDRTGLPDNLTRKVISVDRGSDPKKFLRATVTK